MTELDLLEEMVEHKEAPHFTDENGFTYFLHKKTNKKWVIKKLEGSYFIISYEVDFMQGKWVCDCPAGYKGNKCKHSAWITELSKVM
jgi:hypothetical protein